MCCTVWRPDCVCCTVWRPATDLPECSSRLLEASADRPLGPEHRRGHRHAGHSPRRCLPLTCFCVRSSEVPSFLEKERKLAEMCRPASRTGAAGPPAMMHLPDNASLEQIAAHKQLLDQAEQMVRAACLWGPNRCYVCVFTACLGCMWLLG